VCTVGIVSEENIVFENGNVPLDLTSCMFSLQCQVNELVGAFKELAKEVHLIRDDVRRILAGTNSQVTDLKNALPPHPAKNVDEMKALENFEDTELFVSLMG